MPNKQIQKYTSKVGLSIIGQVITYAFMFQRHACPISLGLDA